MTARDDARASRSGQTNSLAVAALVCGIIEFLFPPACIIAIVLGHIARRQIRRTGAHGYGIAMAGLILGYFIVASTVLVLLIGLVASAPPGLR
jgi:TRAP-type uncharacterized transport system fused permease subunit